MTWRPPRGRPLRPGWNSGSHRTSDGSGVRYASRDRIEGVPVRHGGLCAEGLACERCAPAGPPQGLLKVAFLSKACGQDSDERVARACRIDDRYGRRRDPVPAAIGLHGQNAFGPERDDACESVGSGKIAGNPLVLVPKSLAHEMADSFGLMLV